MIPTSEHIVVGVWLLTFVYSKELIKTRQGAYTGVKAIYGSLQILILIQCYKIPTVCSIYFRMETLHKCCYKYYLHKFTNGLLYP